MTLWRVAFSESTARPEECESGSAGPAVTGERALERRHVALAQSILAAAGLYAGPADGHRTQALTEAAERALAIRDALLPERWHTWSDKRKLVALLQCAADEAGFESGGIDGWFGSTTAHAVEALGAWHERGIPPRLWRDERPLAVNPNGFPAEADIEAAFGPRGHPGGPVPVTIVAVACPWPLRLSYSRNRILDHLRVHERCADSLSRILARVLSAYGPARIAELGLDLLSCDYEARHQRGGSAWSLHAWGAAIDWDDTGNPLQAGRDTARFAGTDYLAWWRLWEEEGWTSQGRVRNFEWGHVQAARPW
jgi:hypothetical protein